MKVPAFIVVPRIILLRILLAAFDAVRFQRFSDPCGCHRMCFLSNSIRDALAAFVSCHVTESYAIDAESAGSLNARVGVRIPDGEESWFPSSLLAKQLTFGA